MPYAPLNEDSHSLSKRLPQLRVELLSIGPDQLLKRRLTIRAPFKQPPRDIHKSATARAVPRGESRRSVVGSRSLRAEAGHEEERGWKSGS